MVEILNSTLSIPVRIFLKTPLGIGHTTCTLMNTLNWSKLDQRWKLHILRTTFKCLKGDAPVYLSSQFSFATHSHTRGQTFNTLIVPSWKNNSGKRTFYYRASKLWNNLPNDICYNYKSMSMLSFKEVLTAL